MPSLKSSTPPRPLTCERSLNVKLLTFSEQTAVSYQTLYILHWTERKGLIKLDIVYVKTRSYCALFCQQWEREKRCG